MNKRHHPKNRFERLFTKEELDLNVKKAATKADRASKVRRKVIKESLKEQETQDELRSYSYQDG